MTGSAGATLVSDMVAALGAPITLLVTAGMTLMAAGMTLMTAGMTLMTAGTTLMTPGMTGMTLLWKIWAA